MEPQKAPVQPNRTKMPKNSLQSGPALRDKIGRLFSGPASCLDAFSTYPLARSCPAMPCRTTGTPEAPARCSSRTCRTLPSVFQQAQQIESDLFRVRSSSFNLPQWKGFLKSGFTPTDGSSIRMNMKFLYFFSKFKLQIT